MQTRRRLPPAGPGSPSRAGGPRRSGREEPPARPPRRPPTRRFTLDSVIRFLLGAGALAALGTFAWYFSWLLVYLAVSGVLAYLMRPVVHRLQGVGMGQVPAILFTFIGVFGSLAAFVVALAPFVAEQVTDLSQQVSVESISVIVRSAEERLVETLPFVEEGALTESLEDVSQALFQGDRLRGTVGSMVTIATDLLYALLAIPFITFFFLRDGTLLRHSLLRAVPNRYFEVTLAIIAKVERSLGRYLRALLVQCTAVAAVASLALSLTGLNYALAVGIFAGLANSIPYFGPLVGFIAGSLVGIAQTGDFSLIFPVFLAMAVTQLADNLLFQPIIFSRAAQAHPLVILFVVLIGAQLGGIVGMLIAIPVATTVRVVAEQILWSVRNYRTLGARG